MSKLSKYVYYCSKQQWIIFANDQIYLRQCSKHTNLWLLIQLTALVCFFIIKHKHVQTLDAKSMNARSPICNCFHIDNIFSTLSHNFDTRRIQLVMLIKYFTFCLSHFNFYPICKPPLKSTQCLTLNDRCACSHNLTTNNLKRHLKHSKFSKFLF